MKKQDVINYFGSQVKAGLALGVSQAAISKWPDIVPLLRAYQLEHITCGVLKVGDYYCHALKQTA